MTARSLRSCVDTLTFRRSLTIEMLSLKLGRHGHRWHTGSHSTLLLQHRLCVWTWARRRSIYQCEDRNTRLTSDMNFHPCRLLHTALKSQIQLGKYQFTQTKAKLEMFIQLENTLQLTCCLKPQLRQCCGELPWRQQNSTGELEGPSALRCSGNSNHHDLPLHTQGLLTPPHLHTHIYLFICSKHAVKIYTGFYGHIKQ